MRLCGTSKATYVISIIVSFNWGVIMSLIHTITQTESSVNIPTI